jgi:hypothetical protein
MAAELDPRLAAAVLVSGLVVFWLLVPKTDERADPLPSWTIAPLAVAFVGGIFLASLLASLDRDLVGAGYGLWFVLWLQFGLWLKGLSSRSVGSATVP